MTVYSDPFIRIGSFNYRKTKNGHSMLMGWLFCPHCSDMVTFTAFQNKYRSNENDNEWNVYKSHSQEYKQTNKEGSNVGTKNNNESGSESDAADAWDNF